MNTKGTSKAPIRPGTCLKGLRGETGRGPWSRHLHLGKPPSGSSLKPGLYMEDGFTQRTGLSAIKITLSGKGGTFSGTALRRTKGKVVDPRAPINGTFKCKR